MINWESMDFELPVITRPFGRIKGFFKDGKMSFITESKKPAVFADFMKKLIIDCNGRKKIAQYNQQYAREHFMSSKVAGRIEEIYRSVLSKGFSSVNSRRSRRWFSRKRFIIPLAAVIVIAAYLLWDAYPPLVISAESYVLQGMPCKRVPDLVVQGHDPDGRLWATRGLWAYQHNEQEDRFVRRYRIPTGPNIYWLFNFTIVRRLSGRVQNVELLPLDDGGAVAISAGWVWYREEVAGSFQKVMRLRYYGINVGRGVLGAGLVRLSDGSVMFGEYHSNPNREDVRVYVSEDDYRTWKVAHEFPPGSIRHVHAVQEDPYTGSIWLFTGDRDDESMVMTIEPETGNKTIIGRGAQRWRVVQAVFMEDAVYWGADTCGPEGGIWRYGRESKELSRLNRIYGAIFYANRLSDGMLVFAHAVAVKRKGAEGYWDDKARLWVMGADSRLAPVVLGTRVERRFMKNRIGIPRLARTDGDDRLYVTLICIDGLHGDMLIIEPSALRQIIQAPDDP